jgi:SAM-dependent methyltransferase
MVMDQQKMEAFLGRFVQEAAASYGGIMTDIGHKLGLYKAMAGAGPMAPSALAQKTSTHERYVLEWLNSQAAGGYVTYDPSNGSYELPDEHAFLLADERSPIFVPPIFDVVASMWFDEDKILEAFKTGKGLGWEHHHHRLFTGLENFYRPGYASNLTTSWIPAMRGMDDVLKRGGKVADVGCGHGVSTIIMAQAYPNSSFLGSDFHEKSIEIARRRAAEAGVADRVTFEVASAKSFAGTNYDLVCFIDCLHDMGDPIGAAGHAREVLASSGAVLLVEPFANDYLEDNINPVGRLYYSASTVICTPASLAQEGGLALGAQAGEARLHEIMAAADFKTFRRVAETPFYLIFEARA